MRSVTNRVHILLCDPSHQAYKSEMYGSKYVWLLPGWFQREWWRAEDDTDCTADELANTVAGYFAIDSLDINIDNRSSISGLVSDGSPLYPQLPPHPLPCL